MKYNPALDGAIAALIVVGFHAMVPVTGGGYLGVGIFVVLSGFLTIPMMLSKIDDAGDMPA